MNYSFLGEMKSRLGEGPAYDRENDTAWWFDIVGKKLFQHEFATGSTVTHDLPFMASAVGIIDNAKHLIVGQDGLFIRDVVSGKLTLHNDLEGDNTVTRSNDSRVHPSGAFWIGTMGLSAEKDAGSIYWYYKGEVRKLFANVSIPNAICFSPDGSIAYFTDTMVNELMRVDVDPATGLPTGEPSVLNDTSSQTGGVDGAVCDADGKIWNARWGGNRMDVYLPDGTLFESIELPTYQTTCPCFVGKDLSQIFVTSAYEGMGEKGEADSALDGRTLLLDIKVNGRVDAKVAL